MVSRESVWNRFSTVQVFAVSYTNSVWIHTSGCYFSESRTQLSVTIMELPINCMVFMTIITWFSKWQMICQAYKAYKSVYQPERPKVNLFVSLECLLGWQTDLYAEGLTRVCHWENHVIIDAQTIMYIQTCIVVPFIDGKVMVTGDGDDSWGRHSRMRVRGYMCHRWIRQELHDHTDIVWCLAKHHWWLKV